MTGPIAASQPVAARPAQHASYPIAPEFLPPDTPGSGGYVIRFARTAADLDAILKLRFEVFNLELNEGLVESYLTARDEDELDWRFHHLMICRRATGEVVGTYRMQTPEMAAALGGFYTAGEFDLGGMPADVIERSVEIGRACVSRPHRNGRVLQALWRGLAGYLAWNRKTGLFGCCSLTSQDPALGVATLRHLARAGCMESRFTVHPLAEMACDIDPGAALPAPHIPALFRSYLTLGAKVCGPPGTDPRFRTIDFLVLLDVRDLDPRVFRTFFG
jgi:putative hemolysin